MSGHADTIRDQREHAEWVARHLTASDMDGLSAVNLGLRLLEVLDVADALVAENQQQAQAIKQLAIDLADLQLRLIERNAENQQLRDALDKIEQKVAHPKWPGTTTDYKMLGAISALDDIWKIVRSVRKPRAALAGTPSEDTE